jgi:hypothetical protein
MKEFNKNVIENIKNTYWGGKSEMTFNVAVNEEFRTEQGLIKQIERIPPAQNSETDVNSGTIFVAIPHDNAEGVMIAPVIVEREE